MSPECVLPWFTIPLDRRYIKVKHCLLLSGPTFNLHFLPDNFNDNSPFSQGPSPRSTLFLSLFLSWKHFLLYFFSCGFFSKKLISCRSVLFNFHQCLQCEFEDSLSSAAVSAVIPQWYLIVASRCWHLTFLLWFWLGAMKCSHFSHAFWFSSSCAGLGTQS